MAVKGLTACIFKNNGESYSNNGISAHHNEVLVIGCPNGDIFEAKGRPVVVLQKNAFGTVRAVPLDLVDRHTMFGGTYISTSDSRFGQAVDALMEKGHHFYGAIPLHDRVE